MGHSKLTRFHFRGCENESLYCITTWNKSNISLQLKLLKKKKKKKKKNSKIQSTKWRAEEDICITVYFNTIEKSILISERHQENSHHH